MSVPHELENGSACKFLTHVGETLSEETARRHGQFDIRGSAVDASIVVIDRQKKGRRVKPAFECQIPNLRQLGLAKPAAVFSGVDENEDHVTQVVGIGVQRVDVVLITRRVGIAPGEAEVQNRHRSLCQKLIESR